MEQVAVYPGDQLPEMGPTKQVVELKDRKGRHYFVPVESLQKGVVEPPNLSTVVLTDGTVAQRIDTLAGRAGNVKDNHWFVPGHSYAYSWPTVFNNSKKEQFTS